MNHATLEKTCTASRSYEADITLYRRGRGKGIFWSRFANWLGGHGIFWILMTHEDYCSIIQHITILSGKLAVVQMDVEDSWGLAVAPSWRFVEEVYVCGDQDFTIVPHDFHNSFENGGIVFFVKNALKHYFLQRLTL